MSEYHINVGITDTAVAFECEADRAGREGFTGVEKRQRDTALHVRNAYEQMRAICPEGHRVEMKLVLSHVPDVNPVLNQQVSKRIVRKATVRNRT